MPTGDTYCLQGVRQLLKKVVYRAAVDASSDRPCDGEFSNGYHWCSDEAREFLDGDGRAFLSFLGWPLDAADVLLTNLPAESCCQVCQ
jgi:hypothetical protein